MTPQIIRTLADLEALDPDTLVNNFNDFLGFPADLSNRDGSVSPWAEIYLPAVVIATGDTVRAARQALEAANGRWNLPSHRTGAGYPNCSTCDGGGCPDCTDPA